MCTTGMQYTIQLYQKFLTLVSDVLRNCRTCNCGGGKEPGPGIGGKETPVRVAGPGFRTSSRHNDTIAIRATKRDSPEIDH